MKNWFKYFDGETIARLAQIGMKPSGLVEGNLVGDHRSPFHGFAIEFAGHRGYVPGDDVKHIDWKAYYKTEKYLVKQYSQETNFIAQILVDISESMKFSNKHGSKLDYAAFIATAIAYVVTNQSDSVGACFFDDRIRGTIPVSGTEEVAAKISNFIQEVEPKSPSSLGTVFNHFAEQAGRRKIIFIISDFFGDLDATFDGLKRLMDDKHELVLMQIIDPLELDFDIPGRVELIELEGSGRIEVQGNAIREAYRQLFHDFLDKMREKSLAHSIDYILCDMSRPFGIHLSEYLSSRAHK